MQRILIRIGINAVALFVAAGLIGGITLEEGFWKLVLVAAIFGIINAVLKPVLVLKYLHETAPRHRDIRGRPRRDQRIDARDHGCAHGRHRNRWVRIGAPRGGGHQHRELDGQPGASGQCEEGFRQVEARYLFRYAATMASATAAGGCSAEDVRSAACSKRSCRRAISTSSSSIDMSRGC